MSSLILCVLLLTAVSAQLSDETLPIRIDAVVTPRSASSPGSCPAQSVRDNITATVQTLLAMLSSTIEVPACGEGGWRQVADLNLTDPSQQCPSPWVEFSLPAVVSRTCTSSVTGNICEGVSFPVSGGTYSRVCGTAVGYVTNFVDAFAGINRPGNIDSPYLDGVSITHGSLRQHIWSLAADGVNFRCPCVNSDRAQAPLPPSFVGDNYFCDGDYNGALWDAMDCTTTCCTFNSPPYFSVSLPTPTSDAIDVRICSDEQGGDERVHMSVLQIFVQ